MKSNNLFTYLLYALLGLLVLAAGYLALEKNKRDSQIAEERKKDYEQLNQTIKEYGYADTTQSGTSGYVGENTPKTTVDKNGIEQDPAPVTDKKSATQPATTSKTTTPTAAPSQPAQTSTGGNQLVAKGGTAPKQVAPSTSGRYYLVVGAFGSIENARSEMERFIKMGYRDAEVVKYKKDLWRVIAKRYKTRAEAEKFEGELERSGIDAMVVDSYKK